MVIRVDGYRSTDENWLYAQRVPPQELPELSLEEREVADNLGLRAEDYARSRLAGEITRKELGQRAETVGRLVESWLSKNVSKAKVKAVWLKTFQGKFRVQIEDEVRSTAVFVDEDLVDDLLDAGSIDAQCRLERLLEASIGKRNEAIAS